MVDLQAEFIAEGRAFHISSLESCLENCRLLLDIARKCRLPIAHFRRVTNGHFFNPRTRYADWIDTFRPRAHEHVYEREQSSCFSQRSFCNLIDTVDEPTIIFAGLCGEWSCLSTAIDGHHRGTRSIFLKECCATGAIGSMDEHQSHDVIFEIIPLYAEVMPLKGLLQALADSGAGQGRLLS